VLSAKVWLPVVTGKGGYASWLEPLDVASRALTTGELDALVSTTGQDRDAALLAATSDIPDAGKEPGPGNTSAKANASGRTYALLVPSSGAGQAVGAYYKAALTRQGHLVRLTWVGKEDAVNAVARGREGDVALLELPDLAGVLGALLPSTGMPGQVRAAAVVAAERSLALGVPTSADRTPQVLVTREFAAAHGNLTDLSGLARACPRMELTATGSTSESLAPLAAGYGLRAGTAGPDAVEKVRAGQAAAVLAPAVDRVG
jgi:hypothetical protein